MKGTSTSAQLKYTYLLPPGVEGRHSEELERVPRGPHLDVDHDVADDHGDERREKEGEVHQLGQLRTQVGPVLKFGATAEEGAYHACFG